MQIGPSTVPHWHRNSLIAWSPKLILPYCKNLACVTQTTSRKAGNIMEPSIHIALQC